MTNFRVGIIGCGRPWRSAGATGFGMSHLHARGYTASPHTTIVALADINPDNAHAFQSEHGGERIYHDYREMLAHERLDIVSVCTWPHLHAAMVIAAAEAGVKAIHCEKPMAPTYGEARRMVEVCRDRGVQLTFNHQRRFEPPYRKARELLRLGAIGQLRQLQGTCSNLFDWGTHWFDMFGFYNDETPVEWVIGQIDPRDGGTVFGVRVEGQGLSHFQYRNGVQGLIMTKGSGGLPTTNRLIGDAGMIEIDLSKKPPLRVWGHGRSGWEEIPAETEFGGAVQLGVLDLIDALVAGREPELSARRALQATELIFATYESSRRRGRVDLPLEIDDSPFLALCEPEPGR